MPIIAVVLSLELRVGNLTFGRFHEKLLKPVKRLGNCGVFALNLIFDMLSYLNLEGILDKIIQEGIYQSPK
jgi:hypothetical protein